MKKLYKIILILLIAVVLGGCTAYNNEIYNRSVVVDIDMTNFEEPIVPIAERATQSIIGVSNYDGSIRTGVGTGVIYKVEAVLKSKITVPYSEELEENNIEEYIYYAVTNRHVIEDSTSIKVYLGDEDIEINAEELGSDDKVDIAVIRYSYDKLYLPLKFSDSNMVKKGSFAIAVGNPSGYSFFGSTTFGIISHPQRYIPEDTNNDGKDDYDTEYIQHNVAINPGNSGGPLINMDGDIIGINTMKLVSQDIDNMGFSIPSNIVTYLIPYLESGLPVPRFNLNMSYSQIGGLSGLSFEEKNEYGIPSDMDYGLIIHDIKEDSFLADYIYENDIILAVDGKDVKYYYSLVDYIESCDDVVIIDIIRNGTKYSLEAFIQ